MTSFKGIRRINLANVRLNQNISFEIFLNQNLIELDFSQNDLGNIFRKFSILTNIEILVLRKVNLQSMEQIPFQNYFNLMKLDLSYNNLTRLNYGSFKNLKMLEYLDLSFNQIYFIDGRIFGDRGDLKAKKLKYLNLESNKIINFNDVLANLINLDEFVISNNQLVAMPLFATQIKVDFSSRVHYFYFNLNRIKTLTYFSFDMSSLLLLDFNNNEISTIESDAFEELKNLQILSISGNFLCNITNEIFLNQLNLINLNLSHNLIEFVELNSFQNLIELKVLDLSFNRLLSIENNLFKGLANLNDLYLLNNFTFRLLNQSFNHLINIGNIYLTRSMIQENKCLFMHSIEREVKRNVGDGKYKFFKSINLVSNDFHDLTVNEYCEFTFEFLQFKIHWNLKSDFENEIFYEKCKTGLTEQRNNFNHSFKKCFKSFQFIGYEKESFKEISNNLILDVLSNGLYLVTMLVLIMYLFPFFLYIYLNLLNEKKDFIANSEKPFAENQRKEDLQHIHLVSEIPIDNSEDITKSSEQISIMSKL